MLTESVIEEFNSLKKISSYREKQRKSVFGKHTPFRVEFRFRGGTKHYQYFCDLESAKFAKDWAAVYGPTGNVVIEYPRSQQIQVKGPRGGWKVWRDSEENPTPQD